MDELKLIKEWETNIVDIFRRENLTCLQGLDPDHDKHFRYKGLQLLMKYHEVTHQCAVKHAGSFDSFQLETDLYFISDEILYYLAHVYLFRPYINNPLVDAHRPPGYDFTVYPNIQNVHAKRYDMHIDTVFEKLYAFWNRIATLLNFFVDKPLSSHAIDFSRVIDILPTRFNQNDGYKWLQDFKLNGYRDFNLKRKAVVHHSTTGTSFRTQHLNARGYDEHEQLMEDRRATPDFLRDNMYLAVETYYQTLVLLEEVNATDFPPVVPVVS